jgi:hypothetical protein
VSVSMRNFPCIKVHSIRAYIDAIQMTLPRASGAEFSFVHSSEVLATNSRLIRTVGKPENPEGEGVLISNGHKLTS